MILPKSMKEFKFIEPKKIVEMNNNGIIELNIDVDFLSINIKENVEKLRINMKNGKNAKILIENRMKNGILVIYLNNNENLDILINNIENKNLKIVKFVDKENKQIILREKSQIIDENVKILSKFFNFGENTELYTDANVEKNAINANLDIEMENFIEKPIVFIPKINIKEKNVEKINHRVKNFSIDDEKEFYLKTRGISKEEYFEIVYEKIKESLNLFNQEN